MIRGAPMAPAEAGGGAGPDTGDGSDTEGVAVVDVLDRLLDLTAADAEALDCSETLEQCRAIVLEGTSADAQLRIFTENEHEGADIALHKVSRWISDATLVA